ncbi:hypothetical protein AgCh_004828 [Apium graveolens]
MSQLSSRKRDSTSRFILLLENTMSIQSSEASMDVLPRKIGRPRKENSEALVQNTDVISALLMSEKEAGQIKKVLFKKKVLYRVQVIRRDLSPPNKESVVQKESFVSSSSNQERFKSTKFFTEGHTTAGRSADIEKDKENVFHKIYIASKFPHVAKTF